MATMALAALAGSAAVLGWFSSTPSFVSCAPHHARDAALITRRAAEDGADGAVPDSDVLLDAVPRDPRQPFRAKGKFTQKRWQRIGHHKWFARQLFLEASRLKPYIEPLVEAQYTYKEILFAMNRQASKLRHLMLAPSQKTPAFYLPHIKSIISRIYVPHVDAYGKTELVSLKRKVRPLHLPRFVPGANTKKLLKVTYAEVPPLKPWTKPVVADEEEEEDGTVEDYNAIAEKEMEKEARKFKPPKFNRKLGHRREMAVDR